MSDQLRPVLQTKDLALYEHPGPAGRERPRILIASTPETRRICNDPFVTGLAYTSALTSACGRIIAALEQQRITALQEQQAIVLHILRGGMNFGLRDALGQALNWNDHSSAFVSAQRARSSANPQDWVITESAYRKLDLHPINQVIFGDVVATGTSLIYALEQIVQTAAQHNVQIASLLFFTIGSPRSHEILAATCADCSRRFESFTGASVVYLEGIFPAATNLTKMHIKIDGTDLLRTQAVLAPEFIESQYESPAYPIERCTIYDAGSRAFHVGEYFDDVHEYWSATAALAAQGLTYDQLLAERMPELDRSRFGKVDLVRLAGEQVQKAARRAAQTT